MSCTSKIKQRTKKMGRKKDVLFWYKNMVCLHSHKKVLKRCKVLWNRDQPEAIRRRNEEREARGDVVTEFIQIRRSSSYNMAAVFRHATSSARLFVVLACHCPTLDGLEQHFQASVHFPLLSTVDKSQQYQNQFWGMPRIKPKSAGWEARMLLLCYAAPPPPKLWKAYID